MSVVAEKIRQAAELAHPIFVAHGWKWGVNYRPLKPGDEVRGSDR